MLLSGRMLDNVTSVNSFDYADPSVEFTEGDTVDIYFQLINKSKDLAVQEYKPIGLRYMPNTGATLTASVGSISNRACTQPFANDTSIWKLSILATDRGLVGNLAITFKLNEGGKITTGRIDNALSISGQGTLCGCGDEESWD